MIECCFRPDGAEEDTQPQQQTEAVNEKLQESSETENKSQLKSFVGFR